MNVIEKPIGSRPSFILRWTPELIAAVFAASVIALTALTATGKLGDGIYGTILMDIITLPISIITTIISLLLEQIDADLLANTAAAGVALLMPGLLEVVLLWWVLHRGRRSAAGAKFGLTLSWLTASLVTLSGIAVLTDSWAPRRPYGLPFALGLLQAGLLITLRHKHSSSDLEQQH
ncbi:hypothetical protein AB0L44_06250 [Nonomuraea wenchangensis]|uniref:hypothetical protein n=1 Tax=Nonomuraea wenchangensis TaxID=568860 RepID=UPI00344937EB